MQCPQPLGEKRTNARGKGSASNTSRWETRCGRRGKGEPRLEPGALEEHGKKSKLREEVYECGFGHA